MASVMRAMSASIGVGKSSSHSHSHSQASNSSGDYPAGTSPPSIYRSVSRSSGADELQRTGSRLQPPNPATVFGSPTGILINATRPYASSSVGSSSSTSLPRNTSSGSLVHLASVPPTRKDTQETFKAFPPSSPAFSFPATPSSEVDNPLASRRSSKDTGLDGGPLTGKKIRFAPLPEIPLRPRSYSTGQDIWLEDADVSEGISNEGESRHFVRRDRLGFGPDYEDDASDDEDEKESDQEDERGRWGSAGVFGSWSSTSSWAKRVSPSIASISPGTKDASPFEESVTNKILRPFGMGKKKSRSNRSPSTERDGLSKTESIESDLSRRSSIDYTKGTPQRTGIPMRKTRSWEVKDGAQASSGGERRRAQYPPVAQRSRRSKSVAIPTKIAHHEPSFVEWGGMGHGSNGSKGSGVGSVSAVAAQRSQDEEDDGSGMAWLKKRRAEREAKQKAEQEAAARVAKENGDTEAGPPGTLTPARTLPPVMITTESTSGTSTPRQSTLFSPPMSQAQSVSPISSGLAATRPDLLITTSSPTSTPPLMASKVLLATDDGDVDDASESGSPVTPVTPSSPISPDLALAARSGIDKSQLRVRPASSDASFEDVEASDEEDEEDRSDDDDDDLDEEELAEEEALAEKARMTAKSAGSERYHDAKHQNRLLQVETAAKK